MITYIRTGSLGLLISFIGALPIGSLNLTAFYIASRKGVDEAIWFALAVVLVELIVVRFSLWGDSKLNPGNKLILILLPLGALLLLYLSVVTLTNTAGTEVILENQLLFPAIQSTFLLGILLSTLNPLHLPFWMGWNRLLSSRHSLPKSLWSYTSYISGIGLGSMAGLLIFIYAGHFIFRNLEQYHGFLNWFLGIVYAGFAIYLLIIFHKKIEKVKLENV